MKNPILSLFILMFFVACESSTIYEKPDNLIPERTMAELIVDLELARYAKGKKNNNMDSKMDYTHLVYEKYGIDSAQYVTSNKYYITDLETYRRIHGYAKTLLEQKKKYYDSIKAGQDSISRAKVQRKTRVEEAPVILDEPFEKER